MDKLERFKREFKDSHDGKAIFGLCNLIRSEKHRGRRVLFHNGDQSVGVLRPILLGGRLTPVERRILMPNSSLVLSDTIAEHKSDCPFYVGDRNWYIGAVTLASALASGAGAALTIVSREQAVEVAQETDLRVREFIASAQEY